MRGQLCSLLLLFALKVTHSSFALQEWAKDFAHLQKAYGRTRADPTPLHEAISSPPTIENGAGLATALETWLAWTRVVPLDPLPRCCAAAAASVAPDSPLHAKNNTEVVDMFAACFALGSNPKPTLTLALPSPERVIYTPLHRP